MAEVKKELAYEHFQNDGNIMPTLVFRRQLALQCMVNTIGTGPGDIGRPMRASGSPQIAEYKLENVQK